MLETKKPLKSMAYQLLSLDWSASELVVGAVLLLDGDVWFPNSNGCPRQFIGVQALDCKPIECVGGPFAQKVPVVFLDHH